VFFTQQRPGLDGRLFRLVKFRTMRDTQDTQGKLLPDEDRITRLGTFMRRSSLDELPEFLNVLKGDMSVVGPRPLLVQYLGRYTSEQARRHNVLPGVTGWAQINGRNALTWEEKFRLDVWYVDHWSFGLDIRIILLTVWKAFKHEGISQPGLPPCPSSWAVLLNRKKSKKIRALVHCLRVDLIIAHQVDHFVHKPDFSRA
jgi:lipopolysaccharide/colanic/teichoic acid biosynthesis glycosyltransferase